MSPRTPTILQRPIRAPSLDPLEGAPRRDDRPGVGARLRAAFTENPGLKLLALILSVTVYLLINTDEHRDIAARLRVAYVLPPDKALVSERIDEVRVTIRGPWRRIKRFDEREIDRITLDLSRISPSDGGEVAITPEMVALPRGLEVTSIEPRVIRVAFEDVAEKAVRVAPSFAGRPLHGYRVDPVGTQVRPPMVTVRGAAGTINRLDGIRTQEIRVDGRRDGFTVAVPLVPPEDVDVIDEATVDVAVAIEEELVSRRVAAVPVTVRVDPGGGDPARWQVEPASVDVDLTGDLLGVERWIDDGVTVSVKVTPEVAARGGAAAAPVSADGAPPGVGVKIAPATVRIRPRK